MDPLFFETPSAFRGWLARHHATEAELAVGFYKVGSGKASISWPQSVDQALAYGWIDGVRHRIDEVAYRIRFTPRKATGIWSQVNIRRYAELDAQGLIEPAGRAAYEAGKAKTRQYSYEKPAEVFTDAELAQFQANATAWSGFHAFPPWYRKVAVHRVTSAKTEPTRTKRLAILIAASAEGRRLGSPTK
ncbi:YdeI/OmpD-associated family protein [Phenylobacterium sp.]|uniref:YdeI/OmpD-associated family protein n=1 Tax=Phenylobacterium sp. TaxID=1871053 RepID=UPI0030F447F0